MTTETMTTMRPYVCQTAQPDQQFSTGFLDTQVMAEFIDALSSASLPSLNPESQGLTGVPTPPLDLPWNTQLFHRTEQSLLGVASESTGAGWSVQRALWNKGQDTNYHDGEDQLLPIDFMI